MTRIRFRTDNWSIADLKANGYDRVGYSQQEWDAVPDAQPGDTWRIHWWSADAPNHNGPIAGYAICCPQCRKVHSWSTATNCRPCPHQGKGSCWQWTGSAEQGTLSASPSLFAVHGCGWHGFLSNGILSP